LIDNKNIDEYIEKSYIDLDYVVFCNNQTQFYLKILEKEGFTDEDKKITEKGQMATQFQEIPSVAFTDFFIKQKDMLNLISTKEYITLFSIFTSIRIPDEDRVHNYESINISDNCKKLFKKITKTLNFWSSIEADFGHNCDKYNIQYDLSEIIYKWTFVQDEKSAIEVFNELDYWGIFIGDFVKAILKINTIAEEVKKVAVLRENLSLVEKMNEVSNLTLKSVITNNSLYL
jgi:superfamily II RNA helicase